MLEVIDRGDVSDKHPAPLLFVHGAWHAAWCWDEGFLDYFADNGFRAVALSLRGHGASPSVTPLRRCSLADYVEDVATVAASLPVPPVPEGHSLGGFIVQKYLETHDAPAGVLMASMPPSGVIGFFLRTSRRIPRQVLRGMVTGNTLPYFETPELTRAALFSSRVADADVLRHQTRLQNESQWVSQDCLFRNRVHPERVATPLLVLGARLDNCFSQGEVHATARAYGTDADIVPAMGHDMMLEPDWPVAAKRIRDWLGERHS